jgi:hypothetical protein
MSSGSGQLSPAARKRLIVVRIVDGAIPIRQVISRVGTPPANFTEAFRARGAWPFSRLGSGPSFGKPKERT